MFHPLIERWFQETFPASTDAQAKAWPLIGQGKHVLVVAPTGSGKTLTAFMGAIDSLVRGLWQGRGVKVLYVSPLKALNNDIRLNLLSPLAELQRHFARHQESFPSITVQTRSGDTSNADRRRLVHHPPDILVTTPESLGIMLCSQSGRGMLSTIQVVILDEIHALAATKRGTNLMAAVERLGLLAGEFQRIGLSATVKPARVVADWMGGWRPAADGSYERRPVEVVESADQRQIQLDVTTVPPPELPTEADPAEAREAWWDQLAISLVERIRDHRSTLIFTNSRRMTEKLCRKINQAAGALLSYSHHGSLSKEIRLDVEQRLKEGSLKAIVATSSLELGIDIGSVDKVILVQTPFAVSQALQRIGRANHRVGGTSFAELVPLHGMDLVHAATMLGKVRQRDIEAIRPIRNPLDILAQLLLALTAPEPWELERLFAFVRRVDAFHELPRRFFDLVVAMLAGEWAGLPLRELRPRLNRDALAGTVQARPGTEMLLYQAGGTIPDRGYFQLRLAADQALLGELDEEFVWERRVGDQFTLGNSAWRIIEINQQSVLVAPARGEGLMVPFWKAEDHNRDFHLASAIGDFLAEADARLQAGSLAEWLQDKRRLEPLGAESLARYLQLQRSLSQAPLPSRRHLLVETILPGQGDLSVVDRRVILHSFWGGRVNKPAALVIAAAWEREHGYFPDCFATNEAIMFQVPADAGNPVDYLPLDLGREALGALLRERLESSGLFGARFRENATRAMLLPRGDARRRVPLWQTRLRSKRLLEAVSSSSDFPLVVETWRDCLEDEFDLDALLMVLGELGRGEIAISRVETRHPSPFAADLVWHQVNQDMYRDDTPFARGGSAVSDSVFRELVGDRQARPPIPGELAGKFSAKLQGTWPEYRPETPGQLVAVLNELGFMPASLWDELCNYSSLGVGEDPAFLDDLTRLSRLFARFRPPGAAVDWIVAVPQLPAILSGLGLSQDLPPAELPADVADWLRQTPRPDPPLAPERLLLRWLERQGPVTVSRITWMFGWNEMQCGVRLQALAANDRVVMGPLIEGSPTLRVCEYRNYETLLRLKRTARREAVVAQPIERLPVFLAAWHGLLSPAAKPGVKELQEVVDRCIGLPLPAELWENVVFATRLRPYQPAWLDSLFSSFGIIWHGAGEQRLFLAFEEELPLWREEKPHLPQSRLALADPRGEPAGPPGSAPVDPLLADEAAVLALLGEPGPAQRVQSLDLARLSGLDSARCAQALWRLAWKGQVSSGSFETVRRGLAHQFKPEPPRPGRGGFQRWDQSRSLPGAWRRLPEGAGQRDPIDRLETQREQVSQLLRRHGVIFRELLQNELPGLQWGAIVRTLRLMELAGEVHAGRFFEGVPGIQYASAEALRRLTDWIQEDGFWDTGVWWVNAADPASLAGLGLDCRPRAGLSGIRDDGPPGFELPRRVASTWMVYEGCRLVMLTRRNGQEIELALGPDHPALGAVLGLFAFLLERTPLGPASLLVETINGAPAQRTDCLEAFRAAGFQVDHRGLTLWRRIR